MHYFLNGLLIFKEIIQLFIPYTISIKLLIYE